MSMSAKRFRTTAIKNMEDAVRAQLATVKATMNPDEVNILIAHGYVIQSRKRHKRAIRFRTSAQHRHIRICGRFAVRGLSITSHLGHLHKAQKVKNDKVRYSGSILKYSKSEAPHQKQTSIVTIEKGTSWRSNPSASSHCAICARSEARFPS